MRASNKKGFTLLEILIAITILSVGLLTMAQMAISVLKANDLANTITDATVIAQNRLETLRNLAYTATALDDDAYANDIGTDIYSNTALFTSPDHTATCDSGCSLTIGLTPQEAWNVAVDTPASGMKTVTAIVGWRDSLSNHFVALSTIIRE